MRMSKIKRKPVANRHKRRKADNCAWTLAQSNRMAGKSVTNNDNNPSQPNPRIWWGCPKKQQGSGHECHTKMSRNQLPHFRWTQQKVMFFQSQQHIHTSNRIGRQTNTASNRIGQVCFPHQIEWNRIGKSNILQESNRIGKFAARIGIASTRTTQNCELNPTIRQATWPNIA